MKNNNDTLTVKLEMVRNNKEFLAITRLIASYFIANSYMTIKEFLGGLSDYDLKTMLTILDESTGGDTDGHPRLCEMIIITELLAKGEGLDPGNSKVVTDRLNSFTTMLAMESLYRKGLIKIYRENFTLGDDMDDKIMCERIK